MTEAEWLDSDDPRPMLEWLRGKVSDRKLRLFACAVARRLPPHGDPERGKQRQGAIEVAERVADGASGMSELQDAERERWVVASSQAYDAAMGIGDEKLKKCQPELAGLVRCVFGNPFRPAAIDRRRLTGDVLAMAAPAYEDREPLRRLLDQERLAVLADALDDLGCGEDVLAHLRDPGPHVRGCWALDLVLGKE